MPSQRTKRCALCNADKPLTDFHRDKSRRDGYRDRCKACVLTYNRAWYEADKDAIIARQMAAYRADPSKKIGYTREWYRRTHPERLAKQAKYRAEHLEEIRAQQRGMTAYHVAKNREWQKRNPERYRANKQRAGMVRRARKRGTQIEPVDTDAIVARDRSICGICGRKVERKDLSFDHIVPLSRGGPHTEANLQVAHWRCNVKRGAGRIAGQMRLPL